jgi:hypothetical protein
MSPQIQTVAALALVTLAATWLILRSIAKKRNSGCGVDCACPVDELKSKLKR